MTGQTGTTRQTGTKSHLRRNLLLALALVAAAALAVFWIFFRYEVFPKRFDAVEPGLVYRSGQISPRLIRETLAQNDIRVVIDLQSETDEPAQQAERQAVQDLGIDYLRLPLGGGGIGDPHLYAIAISTIATARGGGDPVLVHCAGGARRSGGVIAMYELLVRGKSVEEAYEQLDRYGSPPVADTPLVAFLNENMHGIASELVAMGVIAEVPDPLPRFPTP